MAEALGASSHDRVCYRHVHFRDSGHSMLTPATSDSMLCYLALQQILSALRSGVLFTAGRGRAICFLFAIYRGLLVGDRALLRLASDIRDATWVKRSGANRLDKWHPGHGLQRG
jgi:hypothetical protein